MAKHLDLGKKGEDLAVHYLEERGFKILERNWRFRHKEVDIIAREGSFLVIVEVKTRSTSAFGFPDESINDAKVDLLADAAEQYLEEKDIDLELRFDIISITMKGDIPSIYHVREAFHP